MQRGEQRVAGEHVPEPADHADRLVRPLAQQLEQARAYPLRFRGRLAAPWPRRGQLAHVRERVLVQPEDTGQRGEDLLRRVPVPPLLQPDVVVGAHPGQHRQLLAPQAADPPPPRLRQPEVGGPRQFATRAQEIREPGVTVHVSTVRPDRAGKVAA